MVIIARCEGDASETDFRAGGESGLQLLTQVVQEGFAFYLVLPSSGTRSIRRRLDAIAQMHYVGIE